MKVYVVMVDYCFETHFVSIFSTLKNAEEFIKKQKKEDNYGEYFYYWIESVVN